MTPEIRNEWVADLRRNGDKQIRARLHFQGGFCCLGRLLVVLGYEPSDSDTSHQGFKNLPYGYNTINEQDINSALFVKLNDTEKKTFDEIADYIETHNSLY